MKPYGWSLSVAVLSLVLAYDPTQSTGPGTQQGSDGSMSTQRGTGTDSKSGKNEDAGSATGTKRDRSRSGAESGSSHGSARPDTAVETWISRVLVRPQALLSQGNSPETLLMGGPKGFR